MSSNQQLQERRDAALARGQTNLLPVYVERAANAELWDVDGRRYVDFAGGIAVLNTGHLHPLVRAAVERQLGRFSHTCFMVTPYESGVALAERLNDIVPIGGPTRSMFVTTGAEAVENAVKIARSFTGRSGVIAFSGGFHGRTMMCMGLTGKVLPYKASFGPMPAEIYHAPYPMTYRGVSAKQALDGIAQIFKVDIDPSRVAAMIVEPVLGEGGYYVAPPEFLRGLREICDRHGIVLIADEIQSGFARTGQMFAIQHAGVEPDLITMAKSLAGGFPLAAVTGRREIMDAPEPGGLGGTYAASPLATEAALAVLDVIEKERLVDRANAIGGILSGGLMRLGEQLQCIGDVRGLGAMLGCELVRDKASREPDAELAGAVMRESAQRGLVLLTCGMYGNVLRIMVPLTASDEIVREGLEILSGCLRDLGGQRAVA
jgi:4-aminobutyrate aminotransferase/(S)-3-amino-2-methylpropionate transaminase